MVCEFFSRQCKIESGVRSCGSPLFGLLHLSENPLALSSPVRKSSGSLLSRPKILWPASPDRMLHPFALLDPDRNLVEIFYFHF